MENTENLANNTDTEQIQNQENTEVKEIVSIKSQSLNGFLLFIIYVGMIRTVITMISRFLEYATLVILGSQTEQNYLIFRVVYTVIVLIHLTGLFIIVKSKNLIGLFIVIGGLFLGAILSVSLNAIFSSEIFDTGQQTMQFVIQIIFMALALLLRSKGKSAYQVLTENFKKSKI
jgi:hypothetical protein